MFRSTPPYFVPLTWLITVVHRALYRLLGGRFVNRFSGNDLFLLTARGRKSGKPRTVPLLYALDGARFILVASNWGGPKHASWYVNLRANPSATVQIGRRTIPVTATTAQGEERERLWKMMTGRYKGYVKYARRTEGVREIPVVVLTPRQ